MDERLIEQADSAWSSAADRMTEACRMLESAGLPEDRIERLYRAMDEVTAALHAVRPPRSADERDANLGPVLYTPATILANDAGPDAAGDLRASTAAEIRQHGIDFPVLTGPGFAAGEAAAPGGSEAPGTERPARRFAGGPGGFVKAGGIS
jgi:hypothetical protein